MDDLLDDDERLTAEKIRRDALVDARKLSTSDALVLLNALDRFAPNPAGTDEALQELMAVRLANRRVGLLRETAKQNAKNYERYR